jgi:antitoxin component of RelBE/YafQ-DinJ toxin-antitoxin module
MNGSAMTVDEAIRMTYQETGIPADRLLLSNDQLVQFCRNVQNRAEDAVIDEIPKRLLYLRKQGKLPRTRR